MARQHHQEIEIAKRYIAVLKEHGIQVESAYLYGSYANGTPEKDSDIDILVVSKQFTHSRFEDSVSIAKYRWDVDIRISPLAYHPDNFIPDNIIPYEAMKYGIRID